MKAIYILAWMVVMTVAIHFQSLAQCSLLNPQIELNSVSDNTGSCTVNINLTFTIDKNNGNKFTYVHLWTPTAYPNISYGQKGPSGAQLGAVLATLAIDTDGAVSLLSEYSADPTNVIPLYAGLGISESSLGGGLSRITITNIQFPVPGACTALPVLKGDVWSTQAASDKPNIHCYSKEFRLQINDPVISGNINCNDPLGPRTYNLDITSTTAIPFPVVYKVYLDDGVLVDGELSFGAGDLLLSTSPSTNLSAGAPIQIVNQGYTYQSFENKRSLWVELSSPSLPNTIIAELKNNCLTDLPVTLARFSGTLLDDQISLAWTTTEESGSSHFDVERSLDSREFAQLGRVEAQNNSSVIHRYSFLDTSPLGGINYYRLRMADLDGSFKYSKIVAVENNPNGLVFELLGNPATSREIRFLLKNGDASQIRLFDLSGKTMPCSLTKTGNHVTLTARGTLTSGLYVLSLQQGKSAVSRKVLVP